MTRLLPHCIMAALVVAAVAAADTGLDRRFVAPCGHGSGAAISAPSPATQRLAPLPWRLTLRFQDAADGSPLAVRAGVFDGDGIAVVPDDPASVLFQAVNKKSYFYADGSIEMGSPAGTITVRAGHGFEYEPLDTTVVVGADTELVLGLRRIVDMRAQGWFPGDTHIHVEHPPVNYSIDDGLTDLAVRAEDLGFANVLELEHRFTGALHPLSDAGHLLYFSMEQRNAHFGHLSIVGMKQWIPDLGCGDTYQYCGRTLNHVIHEAVHEQGDDVLVIVTHPFATMNLADASPWPGGGVWRGMPMDLLDGVVDAVDLLCYTNAPRPEGLDFYHHALNAGFKVPPSAGSDANLASGTSYPPGGYRVYVKTESGQLGFPEWVDGLRNGRSFVSNHPLVTHFEVGGAGIGETCTYRSATVKADLSVVSAVPVELVELIGDGRVLATWTPPGDGRDFSCHISFDPAGLGWVVARVTGAQNEWHLIPAGGVFAQTAPVWMAPSFSIPAASPPEGNPTIPAVAGAAIYFKDFTADIEDLFHSGGAYFPDEGSRADFDTAVTRAAEFYEQLYSDPPGEFSLVSPMEPVWALGRPAVWTPTPELRWEDAVDPEGDAVLYMLLLDTSPGFPAPLVFDNIAATSLTVPGSAGLLDGVVYHWKVIARDPLGNQRESAPSEFVVVLTSTPAASPPASWSLQEPWPNPFFRAVSLRYTLPGQGGRFRMTVFDATGRVVRRLLDRQLPGGPGESRWDGRDENGARAPSGVYFFRMERPGGQALVRRAVLLK